MSGTELLFRDMTANTSIPVKNQQKVIKTKRCIQVWMHVFVAFGVDSNDFCSLNCVKEGPYLLIRDVNVLHSKNVKTTACFVSKVALKHGLHCGNGILRHESRLKVLHVTICQTKISLL